MEIQEQVGEVVDTTATQENIVEETPQTESEDTQVSETKSFTQEQVNEFIRQRLERERNSVYSRYGVKDKTELDNLVGMSQSYQIIKERYAKIQQDLAELTEKLAFAENDTNPERKEDILAYFKGKGLEFNSDTLKQEIATHPEWLKVVEQSDKPISTIQTLSPERGRPIENDEREEVAKLFGLSKII